MRPRLEVAGADLAMMWVICIEDDGSGAPTFPRDLHLIADAKPAPALVIVDAWLDTVPAVLSVRDPQQARQGRRGVHLLRPDDHNRPSSSDWGEQSHTGFLSQLPCCP